MCMALNLIACAVRLRALECELFIIIVVLLLPLFKVLVVGAIPALHREMLVSSSPVVV